jgi:Domain of unknown function (DUF4124)
MSNCRRVPALRAMTVFAACAVLAPAALAEVYKCAGDGGRPVYQEMPCPKGKELRNFQQDPPEITVLPGVAKSSAPQAPAPAANARPAKDANAEKTANPRNDKRRGDPAERRHLHSGMSEGDVLARVGTPDITTGQKNGKQVRWTWLPAEGDPETVTTVTFVAGVVTSVERTQYKK